MSGYIAPKAPTLSISAISEDVSDSFFDCIDIADANCMNITHGDQDLNSDEHARQRRELLDKINNLQAMGLGTELELPQIACVGSQSVGKSSLIESISGVALPRASGTCTRCPIECRLKRSEKDWVAKVYLRFESGKSGYEGKTSEIRFGSPMTDRKEVQERIRRAQLAILNPTMDPDGILSSNGDVNYPKSRSFSENCVIVVLEGRELSDLNFVDLPGLIANVTDDKNIDDIDLVKKLVTSYICRPSCLILLTISCESDFENQGAGLLTREYDPQGQRTIGVLTKPDRIEKGSESLWISTIKNQSNPLRHGWFSVKQPSARELELGMSWSEGRKLDQKFFDNTAPWSTIPDEWRTRLGCSRLISHLGDTLGKVILTRLPKICNEVDRLITLNSSQLAFFPQPPSVDSLAEVLQLINSFAREVSHHVKGDPQSGRTGLVQSLVLSAQTFQENLRENIPVFVPTREEEGAEAPARGLDYGLGDIVELAEGARTRELPGEIPFAVTEELITRTLRLWREPVQAVFIRAERIFVQRLAIIVDTHFGKHSYGGLKEAVLKMVFDKLDELKGATLRELDFLLDMESLPFTLNSHYYLDYKEKFLKYYSGCRNEKSKEFEALEKASTGSRYIEDALASLRLAGFGGLKREDLLKHIPSDFSQHAALEIMASARAYYQAAYTRFADTVPLAIDQRYIRAFEQGIQNALVAGLKISSPDAHERCAKWTAESQSIVHKRTELIDRKHRLESARMELIGIPGVLSMRDKVTGSGPKPPAQPHRSLSTSPTATVDTLAEALITGPKSKHKKTPVPVAGAPPSSTPSATGLVSTGLDLGASQPLKPAAKAAIPAPSYPSNLPSGFFSFSAQAANAGTPAQFTGFSSKSFPAGR